MSQLFEIRSKDEERKVIQDILGILKLRRSRPDAPGARIVAIGRLQSLLEEQQARIEEELNLFGGLETTTPDPELEEVGA